MTLPATSQGLGKLGPGAGSLGLWDQPVRSPGAGEVTIEVIAAGICGTDLHIADDEFPSEPPVTMGHEVTGEVAVLGEGVDQQWLGRRVAVETYYSYCEECESCRSGFPNLCNRRRSIGSREDGGFTRWLTIPARNLHELPHRVGRHAGALAEPLACVANLLFDPPVISSGDVVLTIGPGTMGLLTAQAARMAGGEVVLAGLDRDRPRLQLAETLGFSTQVIEPGQLRLDIEPPHVVCECSGSQAGAVLGLEMIRSRGHFVQVGIFGAPITVPLDTVLYKELTMTSGNASTPASWERAMQLLHDGVVLDPIVSEVVPLSDWERAFAATRAGTGLKYVLDPKEEA